MIERVQTITPAIKSKNRSLTIEELQSLGLPLKVEGNLVFLDRSMLDYALKKPISIELEKILAVREKGLIEYIFRSCLNDRPSIIPYIFDYPSMINLVRHLLRKCTGSARSCVNYSANVKKYAEWLGYNPDKIIEDVKPFGAIPDPMRIQNHCGILEDYLAYLQDNGLKPSSISNCIKAVQTFYRKNGAKNIALDEPLSCKVTFKDRAPKPEEVATMLDKADTRNSFIISALATGGFREGTFSKLKYRHVREDFEAGRIPIHVHVEKCITKGKYHDYDTFLNAETCHLLRLYIDERKKGTEHTPPETLTDESPLIRNTRIAHKVVGVTEKAIRQMVHELAVSANVAKKLPDSWMYDVRTHSLRKYFRTQMLSATIKEELIQYMLGHTVDTYADIQSLGIERLRNAYTSAAISIRPKTKTNKIDQLKEIIRSWGENPEEILSSDALMRGNITESNEQIQKHQLDLLANELKQLVKKELSE